MAQKEENQIRAAIYLRVSSEEQKEKFGIELQRSSIESLLHSKGKLSDGREAMVLAGNQYIYKDEAISGTTSLVERPGFSQLIEDITMAPEGNPPFDLVAVYKIDRFARRLKILLEVIDLFERKNIQFISANESIDTSTPFGKAILAIVGVIAELEIETTKMRTQDGRKQAIEEGIVMGQSAPYGYSKDVNKKLQIFEKTSNGYAKEAKVVEDIFKWCAYEKMSPQRIADKLTKDECLSPEASIGFYGKRKGEMKKTNSPFFWRAERVRDILQNRLYLGEYWHHKIVNGKDVPKSEWKLSSHKHEPIIDLGTFEIAQEVLKRSVTWDSIANTRKRDHTYLLSGLLKCGYCHTIELTEGTDPHRYEYEIYRASAKPSWTGNRKKVTKSSGEEEFTYSYQCDRKNNKKFTRTCPVLPIPAEPLENYIVNFVRDLLRNPQAVFAHQQDLPSTKKRVLKLKNDRQHLTELINALPGRKQRLNEQHEMAAISTQELKEKLVMIQEKGSQYKKKIEEIDHQISQQTISDGYIKSFEVFAEKYKEVLADVNADRRELYEMLHILIDEIIVWSRPVNPEIDVVAGRKKEKQLIPHRVDIILHLPQKLLQQMVEMQFGVKNPHL